MRALVFLQVLTLTAIGSDSSCCGISALFRKATPPHTEPPPVESHDPQERVRNRLTKLMDDLKMERVSKIKDGRGAFLAPTEFRPSQVPLEGFDAFLRAYDNFQDILSPSNPLIELIKKIVEFRRHLSQSTVFWEICRENKSHENLRSILKYYGCGCVLGRNGIEKILKSANIDDTIIDPQAFVEMAINLEKFFDINYLEEFAADLEQHALEDDSLTESLASFAVFLYTAQREHGGPYKRINDALKTGKVLKFGGFLQKEAALVHYGFTYLASLGAGAIYGPDCSKLLWRGMQRVPDKQFDAFVTHQDFTWASYVSTSEDVVQATNFCRRNPDDPLSEIHPESVLFCIHFQYDTYVHAIKLEQFSSFPEEREILFAPFCKFFVMKKEITESGGRGIVHLQYDGFYPRDAHWKIHDEEGICVSVPYMPILSYVSLGQPIFAQTCYAPPPLPEVDFIPSISDASAPPSEVQQPVPMPQFSPLCDSAEPLLPEPLPQPQPKFVAKLVEQPNGLTFRQWEMHKDLVFLH